MAPGREWVPGFNEKYAKCTGFLFSIPTFHPKRKTPKAQGWHSWVKVILRMQSAERVYKARPGVTGVAERQLTDQLRGTLRA